MHFKRHLPKILLSIGFLALFLIIYHHSSIKEIWLSNVVERANDYFSSLESDSQAKRRRPFSLADREVELKLYIGEPFKDFTGKEWRKFWDLVYGQFPKENRRFRQLTLDEIAFELMSLYPQPFAYFQKSHWDMLFSVILKK